MNPQLSFDFGIDQVAANDLIYSTKLFRKAKQHRAQFPSPESFRNWVLVMTRAKWKCENCKISYADSLGLTIHHDEAIEIGGDPDCLANQFALCRRCHDLKTSQDALRYGWAKSSYG